MMMQLEPYKGQFDGQRHVFAVRVYYEDTDLSGIVYHANYLRWFERARSDMLRLLGIDQRAAADAGDGFYTVADLSIRYAAPARLDDAVRVETTALDIGAASIRLLQRALRMEPGQGDILLAEAEIRVGFVSPEGRPRRQPQAWRDSFTFLSAAQSPGKHTA